MLWCSILLFRPKFATFNAIRYKPIYVNSFLFQLPPLNFTTTCTEHGRYVVFYNERLDRMTYPSGYEIDNVVTELCEVIVQGKYIP